MEQKVRSNVNTLNILCLPPKGLVMARFEERKSKGGEDFENVSKIYDSYMLLKNMFPYFVVYNYDAETAEEFIKREIYKQK